MKELCEVEGIKFYDTPEMGIACRVSEINRAITGQANRNNFKQDMLDYEYVKNAFSDPAVRKNQIQYLEYNGTGKTLFISLKLVLFHLESGRSRKYKKGWDRVLQAIKENSVLNSAPCFTSIKEILPQIEENPVLNSTSHSTHQEETMKELCEIKGIKFFETSEMGVVCLMSEINRAITGRSSGSFKRIMLDYQYIREAFKDPIERNKQIQNLGEDQRVFVTLKLVHAYLKGTKPDVYKEQYDAILHGIKENFPDLKDTPSGSDSILDSDPSSVTDITLSSDTTAKHEQIKLPIEKTYSYLYIAKGMDTGENPPKVRDIHFGITADGLKDRIKNIESGNYYVGELVATIAFEGTQTRSDGGIIASEDCMDLEKWFKTNSEWQDIQGKKETFLYKEPWVSLLEEIENSQKTGPPFNALYPENPVISKLVPEHLIPKIHDFGESLEMMEIGRFYKGDVILGENNLNVSFEGDWIVVQGLRPVKKR